MLDESLPLGPPTWPHCWPGNEKRGCFVLAYPSLIDAAPPARVEEVRAAASTLQPQ